MGLDVGAVAEAHPLEVGAHAGQAFLVVGTGAENGLVVLVNLLRRRLLAVAVQPVQHALVGGVLAYGLLAGGWDKEREFPEGDHRAMRWTQEGLGRRIEQLDSLRFLVRGEVTSLRAAAVRFVLANHLVSSAIVGPKTVAQLEQLVREVGGGPVYMRDDALSELPRVLDRIGVDT